MNDLIFSDILNDELIHFKSDATQSTVNSIPEVEWCMVKTVLINFGYTVVELPTIGHDN